MDDRGEARKAATQFQSSHKEGNVMYSYLTDGETMVDSRIM